MKKKISIILNILIVIFEVIALIMTISSDRRIYIEYFTVDSNMLALFSSIVYLVFVFYKNKIPKWLEILKYVASVCLTMTFLVVLFILAPMYGFNYYYLLLYKCNLFYHLLCPIIFVVTVTRFDKIKLKENYKWYGLGVIALYAVIMIILNIVRLIDGPYPFLRVLNQTMYMSLLWILILFGLAYGICIMIYKIYRR